LFHWHRPPSQNSYPAEKEAGQVAEGEVANQVEVEFLDVEQRGHAVAECIVGKSVAAYL
jgi:hypothetical protein